MPFFRQAPVIILVFMMLGLLIAFFYPRPMQPSTLQKSFSKLLPSPTSAPDPLSITFMRQHSYPGSTITIEQNLQEGSNYHQYLASYKSDRFKIYGLLTVPSGDPPKGGWPAIIFNHGYIQPNLYVTTERYVAYVDGFAKNGYVVFKPDYRGHGNSEGTAEGAYYSPAYTIDDLNAIASIKKLDYVNANKIGIWGHSMGGNITLRDIVVDPTVAKAVVIWSGVVGSYEQLYTWHDPYYHPPPEQLAYRSKHRSELIAKYGPPSKDSPFWQSVDPTNFLTDVVIPIQLDVGDADEEVPSSFSMTLYENLKQKGKTAVYYSYSGSDHNISQGFTQAMQRSVTFFNTYVKGEQNTSHK